MINYILPFSTCFIISLVLTKLVRDFAVKRKLAMSQPRERDVHNKPTPRLGGVAIFLTFIILVIGYWLLAPSRIDFNVSNIGSIDKNLLGLLLGSLIIIVTGIYDDIKGLSAWQKLLMQIIAALLVVSFGIKIHWLSNPLGGLNIELGNWTYLLVPIWIVLLINSMNWIDSIDGLAGGISFIAAGVLFFLSYKLGFSDPNQKITALLSIITAGSILGFMPFNFHIAKIFLGDSGSMFIGFILAVLAIVSGAKVATLALVLGIVLLDAVWVVIRRVLSHQPIWQADKFHLPHRFLRAGFNQKQTVVLLYIVSVLFGSIALSSTAHGKLIAGFVLIAFLIVLAIILKYQSQKKLNN